MGFYTDKIRSTQMTQMNFFSVTPTMKRLTMWESQRCRTTQVNITVLVKMLSSDLKHVSENVYFQTFAINNFRENQAAWQLFVSNVHLILSIICWMQTRISAAHFCDALPSIPINSIVWVSKYTQPESECFPLSFYCLLLNNHITLKIIVARRGDSLYCVSTVQCRVGMLPKLSHWCRKVEKDKCSLRSVLLAGCSIRSPHPENLLIANLL